MCFVDLEPCSVWQEDHVKKSRKEHRCQCCRGVIAKGSSYVRHFSVFEGDPTSEKMCGECEADRGIFSEAHDSQLCVPSYFPHLLADCIADGDEESEKTWRPMLERIKARKVAKP